LFDQGSTFSEAWLSTNFSSLVELSIAIEVALLSSDTVPLDLYFFIMKYEAIAPAIITTLKITIKIINPLLLSSSTFVVLLGLYTSDKIVNFPELTCSATIITSKLPW